MEVDKKIVWLVGSKSSNKVNQYIAVCADQEEARKVLSSTPAATHIVKKEVDDKRD